MTQAQAEKVIAAAELSPLEQSFTLLELASVFGLSQFDKEALLLPRLNALTQHYMETCDQYAKMAIGLGGASDAMSLSDLLFLPVRLFKEQDLRCDAQVLKSMLSSGTTGQARSKIHLNANTAKLQSKALSRIMSDFVGKKRRPMLVLDAESTFKSQTQFTARSAAVRGFSMLANKLIFALDDQNQILSERLNAFIDLSDKQGGGIIFGFTWLVYSVLLQFLESVQSDYDLSNTTLIHGGGWKKLQDQAISNQAFKDRFAQVSGLQRIHNYYGMVEQAGSIYVECEKGHLHCSVFSDVIVRNAAFQSCAIGEAGLIQVISTLPESYPGHSLITEDLGVIQGVDDCACGRKGKYFSVLGRAPAAELRGCSDVYAH